MSNWDSGQDFFPLHRAKQVCMFQRVFGTDCTGTTKWVDCSRRKRGPVRPKREQLVQSRTRVLPTLVGGRGTALGTPSISGGGSRFSLFPCVTNNAAHCTEAAGTALVAGGVEFHNRPSRRNTPVATRGGLAWFLSSSPTTTSPAEAGQIKGRLSFKLYRRDGQPAAGASCTFPGMSDVSQTKPAQLATNTGLRTGPAWPVPRFQGGGNLYYLSCDVSVTRTELR